MIYQLEQDYFFINQMFYTHGLQIVIDSLILKFIWNSFKILKLSLLLFNVLMSNTSSVGDINNIQSTTLVFLIQAFIFVYQGS